MIIIEDYNITMPVGDTGSFDIVLEITGRTPTENDYIMVTFKDSSNQIIKQVVKNMAPTITVDFINSDTDSLAPQQLSWDVRYIFNAHFQAGKIVDGDIVDTPRSPMVMKLISVVGEV